jgi:tRNA(fMet)-specific endonuclease VapC
MDRTICVALLKGKDRQLVGRVRERDPEEFTVSSVVKAELLFGARKSTRLAANLALLQSFFSQFTSLPFDDDAAEEYGILRVLLEKAGTPMDANDLIIASVAMVHDLTVLTRKRTEFARVPGLRWEAW